MPACRWRSAHRKRRRLIWSPGTRRSPTAAGTSGTPRSSRSRTARRGRRRSVRAARADTGHQPAGCLHHDRTSWPATRIATSTRSGASSRCEAPTASAGRQRSRPARTTTPRTSTPTATSPADPRAARGRGVRAGRGSVERQQRQQRGQHRQQSAVLGRRRDLRLAGLPPGDDQGLADPQLPAARGRPRPGRDRPIHRLPAAARRRGLRGWFIVGTEPKNRLPREACGARSSSSWPTSRSSTTGWSGTATGCAVHGAGRRGGRTRPYARHLLLQQRLPPSAGRGARSWARTVPNRRRPPSCDPAPDAGCQWRDPVVRAPGAVRRCAGACLLPARSATPSRVRCPARTRRRHLEPTPPEPTPTPEPDPTPTPERTPPPDAGKSASARLP